jgi:SAM-dependent methyltransferase
VRADDLRRAARKRARWARNRLRGTPTRTPDGVKKINRYGRQLTDEQIAAGRHREVVGGAWDEIGRLQLDYLVDSGLAPSANLLDVGCGALRGGVHLAGYLEPGHYYGIDVNESLLRAALVKELPEAGLADRVPPENLRVTARFECDFGVAFDTALAVSVFTHLPLNHIRLCLFQVAAVMAPGGRFLATYFPADESAPFDKPVRQKATRTFPEHDPYHYLPSDLAWAATSVAPWDVRPIGDWGHPRGQHMIEFVRRADG